MADRERVREAAAHRRLYAQRKAAGVCAKCGGPRDSRFIQCLAKCIARTRRSRGKA